MYILLIKDKVTVDLKRAKLKKEMAKNPTTEEASPGKDDNLCLQEAASKVKEKVRPFTS